MLVVDRHGTLYIYVSPDGLITAALVWGMPSGEMDGMPVDRVRSLNLGRWRPN